MSEKQSNKERIKEITAGIEKGIMELFESDRYRNYLTTMSRFHKYSLNNVMLIHAQRPNATLVAGFSKWKNSFGRHVRKGEKGIQILAPTPYKIKQEEQKLDPDTKLPMLDDEGKPITEEKEVTIPMFKVVSVFDVAQTEGKPLPQISFSLTGDVAQYEVFMEALRRTSQVPITIEPMEPGMDGYFSLTKQAIFLREGMSQVQTVCAAIHEMAHSQLHNYEKMTELADDGETILVPGEKDRNTEEVEAESISYAVCQYFGIETADNSFGYIASWSQGKALKELRASLETINKTSSELITEIEQNFRELCKEKGIDLTSPEKEAEETAPEVNPPEVAPEVPQTETVPEAAAPIPTETINDPAPAPARKPDYRLVSNFHRMGDGESTYIQKYLPSEDSRIIPAEIVFLGTYEKCLEIHGKLKDGSMTEQEVKALDDSEKLYIISGSTYLHIQRTDDGFDYSLYDKKTSILIDSGQIGSPEQHIYSACLEICDAHGLDGYQVKYAPVELAESLREAQEVQNSSLPEQELDVPLPDPTITMRMMEHYGYTDPDMLPLSQGRALELMERDVTVYMLYHDNTDAMAFDTEDIVNHDGVFGITREEWQDICESIPQRDVHRRFLDAPGDAYAIMQLKEDAPPERHFVSLERLDEAPSPDHYDTIYTGPIVCEQSQMATLERLYEIFNINRPGDFTGHSLSVSDIVALKQDGVVSYHYCDSIGFKDLPDFRQENYLKAAEMSTEDDYGMIDGIINNGKQPTVAELEQQAKSGQPISLMDLADAVHREKKPSVLEKLKDQPQQPQRKSKPRKSKEKEI